MLRIHARWQLTIITFAAHKSGHLTCSSAVLLNPALAHHPFLYLSVPLNISDQTDERTNGTAIEAMKTVETWSLRNLHLEGGLGYRLHPRKNPVELNEDKSKCNARLAAADLSCSKNRRLYIHTDTSRRTADCAGIS